MSRVATKWLRSYIAPGDTLAHFRPQTASAHTLRHTFAQNYLAQYPGDIIGLATLLGHSSLDTTRLYSQPTVSQLSTRVEQLKINAYAG
ncbi:MAG TPA: tyrosine-type recombinase/integrase [Ktedonobacteraceae bacterium]